MHQKKKKGISAENTLFLPIPGFPKDEGRLKL